MSCVNWCLDWDSSLNQQANNKILFIIGGAERLVVDASIALQKKGHEITFFTSHHDPNHCFEETRDGWKYYFSNFIIIEFFILIFYFIEQ